MTSVLLVEDSEIMRSAIKCLLNTDPEIQLLAEAINLREAIDLTKNLHPEVVILDLHLGDEGSILPSTVKSSFVGCRIVAMSFANDREVKEIAERFGAAILLDKMTLASDLIPAIKRYPQ